MTSQSGEMDISLVQAMMRSTARSQLKSGVDVRGGLIVAGEAEAVNICLGRMASGAYRGWRFISASSSSFSQSQLLLSFVSSSYYRAGPAGDEQRDMMGWDAVQDAMQAQARDHPPPHAWIPAARMQFRSWPIGWA